MRPNPTSIVRNGRQVTTERRAEAQARAEAERRRRELVQAILLAPRSDN